MITAASHNYNDMVQNREEEIILNGRPSSLRGKLTLMNNADDMLFVQDIPLQDNAMLAQLKGESGIQALPVNTILNPKEERVHQVSFNVHPQTPPGVYENEVVIGGSTRKLKMIVQENIAIKIEPRLNYFTGVEPGKTYSKELLLTNNSNVPVTVPDIRHNTALNFDYICRSLSLAIREKGGEGFMATMDALTMNIHKEMIDWVVVKIDEAGATIEPGASLPLHLSITLPQNVDPKKDYFGNIRFWNRTITYKIKSERSRSSAA